MRAFGENEKQIIREINTGYGSARNLVNIFESTKNLSGVRVSVNKSSMIAEYLFESQAADPTSQEIQFAISVQQDITKKLIEHLILLKYLEKEDLATFFEPALSNQQLIEFGAGAVNKPSFAMVVNDKKFVELLVRYLNKEIFPSPSLRHLESNDFLSEDEVRFRGQQRATWSAIAITFLIGAIGIYGGYQNYLFQKSQAKQSSENISDILASIDRGFESLNLSNAYPHAELDKVASELSKMNAANASLLTLNPEE